MLENAIMGTATMFGAYAILWAIPGVVISAIISLGDYRHIVFIDKQLAKSITKIYDEKGDMRPSYKLSYAIGSRFLDYCFSYPFIQKRASNKSIRFRAFMWLNAIGCWSWVFAIVLSLLGRGVMA
ncbi:MULTISPECIES: hypothetical protein [Vibrio]|uniref:hypothetical protein n=1 Tax=Vibrio TaxID=662 RepID=UPI0020763187|nr:MULTISPECIES: hypothetical protein [Vibrio]